MHGTTASAPIRRSVMIRGAIPSRGVAVVACMVIAFALADGGRAEESGSDGTGSQPAPVPFTVDKRVDKLFYYPCADCHEYMDANNTT